MASTNGDQPPPAYADAAPGAGQQLPSVDLAAFFARLQLSAGPGAPTPDTCIAHLKFLSALETLKEDVGYSDGLWGLWDSRANDYEHDDPGAAVQEKPANGDAGAPTRDQEALSRVREKRWAVFVARAVDRYETWWKMLNDSPPLTEDDRLDSHSPAFIDFPKAGTAQFWTEDILPPLGKFTMDSTTCTYVY